MVRTYKLMFMAAGAVLLVSGSALASGGGGGGGGGDGGMPSGSASSYDPVMEYQKAVAAMGEHDYKAAASSFGKVAAAMPKAAGAWYGLGRAKYELGDLKDARKAFEKSIKFEPDDIDSHVQLGLTLAKLNETAKSQAELDALKARAATCAEACADAGALKTGIGTLQGALTPDVQPAATGGPAPEAGPTPSASLDLMFAGPAAGDASYGEALALVNEKRFDEALEALNRAQKAFGPHPDVLTYIGYTHRRMGDWATAENYYRQALAIAPNHRGALEYYGELKVEEGDVPAAKQMLAKLERLCAYDCAQVEELRRWIDAGGEPR